MTIDTKLKIQFVDATLVAEHMRNLQTIPRNWPMN